MLYAISVSLTLIKHMDTYLLYVCTFPFTMVQYVCMLCIVYRLDHVMCHTQVVFVSGTSHIDIIMMQRHFHC